VVVGYFGEASSDVHRFAGLIATRLASKHLNTPGRRRRLKGDANPAHLPRLGTLLCTRIRAGYLGSRARQPGSGAQLSQLGERVGR
jgi:hypothetical protein